MRTKNWPIIFLSVIAFSGCALLSRRIEVLEQGHVCTLEGQRVGIGWVGKEPVRNSPHPKRNIWELKVSILKGYKEVFLYRGDTLHLDGSDWKVIGFLRGKPHNRAYVKRLGPMEEAQ